MTTTATTPTMPTVSIEEYLSNPEYEFCEYLDGVILEKYPLGEGSAMVSNVHGALVGLSIQWFGANKKQWGVKPGTEATTVITPTRYRLPDVSIIPFGPMDDIQCTPPLIAIEVLSVSNTKSNMARKLKDYRRMGIPNVWIIDPETRTGEQHCGIESVERTRFEVPGRAIYMDLPALFAQFDEENQPLAD